MKTILYATDCVPSSALALRYANRLSKTLNAELYVLHVYELEPFASTSVRKNSALELNYADEQLLVLKEYCDKHLEHEFGSKDIKLMAEESVLISDGVIKVAKRINADLILVGIRDSESFRNYFTENVGNRLLEKVEVPIMLLPQEIYFHGLSTVVYATDFEKEDAYAIKSLVEFAEPFGALIKVIHIPKSREVDFEFKMNLLEKMVKKDIDYPEIVFCTKHAEDIESGLAECIDEDMPELMVMMEREHHSWLDKLFHTDIVKRIEDEATIPIMVFNQKGIKAKIEKNNSNELSFV